MLICVLAEESVFEGSLRLILTRTGALLFGSLQVIKYIMYISRGQCVGMVTGSCARAHTHTFTYTHTHECTGWDGK